jgi:hypothetical protein
MSTFQQAHRLTAAAASIAPVFPLVPVVSVVSVVAEPIGAVPG